MSNSMTEERTRLRRRWGDQAIKFAMENRWDEAAKVNENILELFPEDVEARNRLGRSLTELGRYQDALAAYQHTLALDKSNLIAKKNIRRLTDLVANIEVARPTKQEAVDPRLFISEEGKTGILKLARITDRVALDEATIGDQVVLTVERRALYASNISGQRLGMIEPQASQRLIDLINGGNRYQAAIMSVDPEGEMKMFVREAFRHESQTGKVSFPPRSGASVIRGYVRTQQREREFDDDDEEEMITGDKRSSDFDYDASDDRFESGGTDDDDR